MLHSITGRLLVPQHPDLIFSLLPEKWLTPGNGGVAFRGLTYDGDILDEIRGLRPGTFRTQDAKVPFHYDPRDRTRLWHRSRHDDRIYELQWRDAHLVEAPLTDVVVQRARQLIKERGGNRVVSRRNVTREIIAAITELSTAPTDEEWRSKLIRAGMRHDQALIDHAEADAARQLVDSAADTPSAPRPRPALTVAADEVDGIDSPAPIDFDSAFPDYDSEAM
jgi:hypothetical protein